MLYQLSYIYEASLEVGQVRVQFIHLYMKRMTYTHHKYHQNKIQYNWLPRHASILIRSLLPITSLSAGSYYFTCTPMVINYLKKYPFYVLNICILISDGCRKNVKCLNCFLLQNQLWSFFLFTANFCQIRSESFITWVESSIQTVGFREIIPEQRMRHEACTEARRGNQV